jgi:multicomponent Na+:H+ antiporter subunit A
MADMFVAVLSGFGLSLTAPWLQRIGHRATGWGLSLLPLGLTVYFASFIGPVSEGEIFAVAYPWLSSLGINFSLYLDGLSLLFALLISGIGALVMVYASSYLAQHPQLGRFYAFILMFMASMLGLVLANNLITFFVFWELTSLSSYLLIGFNHERSAARAAALQALLVTGIGGLALLAGLLLLGQVGGSLELSTLLRQGETVRAHALYLPILLLILAGSFTKSAQFPFHFWLPGAMEAPTPVSAYLHSATMVKAGVYLLARLNPVLGGTESWHYLLMTFGAVTMLLGAVLSFLQTDLKRILAYSTVSALGTLTLLLGIDTMLSVKAAMVFLLVHSLYKGALFMIAGAIDHETGTRNLEALGGLRHAMPITALAAGLAALSMAGLPPLLGFISKELIYEAKVQAPSLAWFIISAGISANILLVAVAARLGIQPFFGQKAATPKEPHEAPLALWLGPICLSTLGLVMGLFPDWLAQPLIAPAVSVVQAEPTEVKLALWHGLNLVLALSLFTVACGVGVYAGRARIRQTLTRFLDAMTKWGPTQGYYFALAGLNAIARAQTQFLQRGYLRFYLLITVATTVGLTGYTLVSRVPFSWPKSTLFSEVRWYEVVLALTILLATMVVVRTSSRLAAVTALGVVGYGIALIFMLYGAPDLAMTQFAIETLSVILFVLVLSGLPRFAKFSTPSNRIRDGLVALSAGGLMTALVLAVTAVPLDSRLAPFFAQNSVPEGKGRNIVNVILVDFRALDTLGEITVLATAALGVYALTKLGKTKQEQKQEEKKR